MCFHLPMPQKPVTRCGEFSCLEPWKSLYPSCHSLQLYHSYISEIILQLFSLPGMQLLSEKRQHTSETYCLLLTSSVFRWIGVYNRTQQSQTLFVRRWSISTCKFHYFHSKFYLTEQNQYSALRSDLEVYCVLMKETSEQK